MKRMTFAFFFLFKADRVYYITLLYYPWFDASMHFLGALIVMLTSVRIRDD